MYTVIWSSPVVIYFDIPPPPPCFLAYPSSPCFFLLPPRCCGPRLPILSCCFFWIFCLVDLTAFGSAPSLCFPNTFGIYSRPNSSSLDERYLNIFGIFDDYIFIYKHCFLIWENFWNHLSVFLLFHVVIIRWKLVASSHLMVWWKTYLPK